MIIDCLFVFILISILGYLYEVSLHLLTKHHFKHSGILSGPYCFIYGIGATIIYSLNYSSAIMFIIGALLCFLLEYLISFPLDYLKLPRWNYSQFPYNLQNRTCLYSIIFFASVIVIYSKFFQSSFLIFLATLSFNFKLYSVIVSLIIISFDFMYTYLLK